MERMMNLGTMILLFISIIGFNFFYHNIVEPQNESTALKSASHSNLNSHFPTPLNTLAHASLEINSDHEGVENVEPHQISNNKVAPQNEDMIQLEKIQADNPKHVAYYLSDETKTNLSRHP